MDRTYRAARRRSLESEQFLPADHPKRYTAPSGQIRHPDRTPESGRIVKVNSEGEYLYFIKHAPVAGAPAAQEKREFEKEPGASVHRKSSSFEEAIKRVEGLIGAPPQE